MPNKNVEHGQDLAIIWYKSLANKWMPPLEVTCYESLEHLEHLHDDLKRDEGLVVPNQIGPAQSSWEHGVRGGEGGVTFFWRVFKAVLTGIISCGMTGSTFFQPTSIISKTPWGCGGPR